MGKLHTILWVAKDELGRSTVNHFAGVLLDATNDRKARGHVHGFQLGGREGKWGAKEFMDGSCVLIPSECRCSAAGVLSQLASAFRVS